MVTHAQAMARYARNGDSVVVPMMFRFEEMEDEDDSQDSTEPQHNHIRHQSLHNPTEDFSALFSQFTSILPKPGSRPPPHQVSGLPIKDAQAAKTSTTFTGLVNLANTCYAL